MRPNKPGFSPSAVPSRCSPFSSRPMVIGVSVRDSPYEASMANTTARPSGVNRYRAGPSRNTTDVNTQAMASVETSVGTAISAEPCNVASGSGMPPSVSSRCVFSMVTVESSTRMPMASARPPNVIVLRVSPKKNSPTIEDRMASGMEIMTTSVERHDPRNSRIISAVSDGGDGAFAQYAVDGIA